MKLTPFEIDRLTIFVAAELARRRRAAGLKLNHPEAVALICDEIFEGARAGLTYDQVVERGMTALENNDLIDGVADLVSIRVEVPFADGTRLIILDHPVGRSRGAAQ